jgi:hypothetical protein
MAGIPLKQLALSGDTSKFVRADGTEAVPAGTLPSTTKGDLIAYSTVNVRLPVGANGQILEADSEQTPGLQWVDKEDVVSENRVVAMEIFN